MHIISDPMQLESLPLGQPLIQALIHEITLPFNDLINTSIFWKEQSCSLVILENGDQLNQVLIECPELSAVIEYPEFVEPLLDGWKLAVAITNDTGGGPYLLYNQYVFPQLDKLLSNCL